jgi:hypothetical protein
MNALIQVDRERLSVTETEMTGRQLCALAGRSADEVDLWLITPLGYLDERVSPNEVVPMFNGLRVFTAPKQINASADRDTPRGPDAPYDWASAAWNGT